ncbi:MAG: BlaI/MecI/CopY family transcriptional regulator [Lachnospiraceae bacterium]|nr:BlaI/MecI/CopY family transcriptional regulator [Lachnospiraceae bacterium]
MSEVKLGLVETRFADIIWKNEPISSGELVRLCAQELEWKKSTTYTVLRKLCERGFFRNENGVVTSLVPQEDFYSDRSKQFVEESFAGSLPAFLTAFSAGRKLSAREYQEIRQLLDSWKPEEDGP